MSHKRASLANGGFLALYYRLMRTKRLIQTNTKHSHGGFEISIEHLIGKSIEYKRNLAFILKIKLLFKSSMINNYNIKELASKLNLSQYIVETYITRLLKCDFCHYLGKHLVFVSLNKIMPYRSRGMEFHITPNESINSIVEKLNIEILKNNFVKQDYVRVIKNHLIKAEIKDAKIDLKSYRKSKKAIIKYPGIENGSLIDRNVIGLRKLSKLLGSSLEYACRFVSKLVIKGLITTKHVIKKYSNRDFSMFSSDELKSCLNKRSGYFFFVGGMTFHYLGTYIDFI